MSVLVLPKQHMRTLVLRNRKPKTIRVGPPTGLSAQAISLRIVAGNRITC